jgi:hypothetical protein
MNRLREWLLNFLDPNRAALVADRNYWKAMAKALPQKPTGPFAFVGDADAGVEYVRHDPGF